MKPVSDTLALGWQCWWRRVTGGKLEEGAMPLFGRKKQPKAQSAEEQPLSSAKAIGLFTGLIQLWDAGRIDIAILGPVAIVESNVLAVLTDLYGECLSTAAHAWRGYEMHGRGFLLLDSRTHVLNYYSLTPERVPAWLPSQTANYCASYDPRTELVIAIYGFPHYGAPNTTASLWMHPHDILVTPPAAWRQLDQSMQDVIDAAVNRPDRACERGPLTETRVIIRNAMRPLCGVILTMPGGGLSPLAAYELTTRFPSAHGYGEE
jgi:hypothetical protein